MKMDSKDKIKIKSLVTGRITINVPDFRLHRTWEKKGAVREIDFETLSQAIYYPGVEYLFEQGILHIEDMKAKVALGLEDGIENEKGEVIVEEPRIIVLDDAQRERYLKFIPLHEFKEKVQKLSWEQKQELATYAIEKEITDFDKADFLKKVANVDIIKAIELKREDKKED